MIDPTVSLAFSIHSARGRYAILLGSGVSSAAGIPTGWSITLDLVRKLAAAQGEECGDDPEIWYRGEFGQSPSYSQLLDGLAKTPYDRREVLSSYIEPDSDDPHTEARQPTAAHHAIATLVRDGYVSVVLTTNFDRLLEQALSAVNVEPVVLSTPEQIEGAQPLSHNKCTIVKLHGDYLDPSIRNTEDELQSYPGPLNALLDRIIDEYGLIVCGWSGEWDPALRAALERAKTRRFATYWTVIGELSSSARSLFNHREAELIEIEDADSFFEALSDRVTALEEMSGQHPASIEAAVALLKRYLSEPRYRIQLRDFIDREVDAAVRRTSPEHLPMDTNRVTDDFVADRLEAYYAAMTMLTPLSMVGAAWAEHEQLSMWQGALRRLTERDEGNGKVILLNLQTFPGTILLYALGIGAVHARRLDFLAEICSTPISGRNQEGGHSRAATLLAADLVKSRIGNTRGYEKPNVALSDWLHDRFAPLAHHLTRDPDLFTRHFDMFELLVALNFATYPPQHLRGLAPMGAFGYRSDNRGRILSEIAESVKSGGERSPYISSGLIGTTVDDYETALQVVESYRRTRFHW